MTLKSTDYYAGRDLIYPSPPAPPYMANRNTPAEIRAYADELEAYEAAMAEARVKRDAYNAALRSRQEELVLDLADEYGLTSKQSAVLFSKAWEDGHSGGIQEVINHFDELVGIVLQFNAAV